MGLPITCADIINLPMDEFNDLLSKHELTEEQLTLCRDIRRRGKNKVAAQNCRKRKIDQIKQLETEVTRIKCRKTELVGDHEKLLQQRATWSDLVKRLHDYVLKVCGITKCQVIFLTISNVFRSWAEILNIGSFRWTTIDRFIFFLATLHLLILVIKTIINNLFQARNIIMTKQSTWQHP